MSQDPGDEGDQRSFHHLVTHRPLNQGHVMHEAYRVSYRLKVGGDVYSMLTYRKKIGDNVRVCLLNRL